MVSNYSDAGQERWLADNGITLLRGTGRLTGTGSVDVDGVRHSANHVVLANGAGPVIPPIPGLRRLEGIWTNREVTGMKTLPRRLLVLGGGPVGVEMAQAVRRFGGEVALIEGAPNLLPREAGPLGEALAEVLRRDGIELFLGVRAPQHGAKMTSTSSTSRAAASCAAIGLRPRAFHDGELLCVTRSTKDAELLADCTTLPGWIAVGLADWVQ